MEGACAAESLAALAHRAYASLCHRALQAHEWTVLAAFAVGAVGGPATRVVSLATGTKCCGAGDVRIDGLVVCDCHAEVLARRALKRTLLLEVTAHHAQCSTRGSCALHEPLLLCSAGVGAGASGGASAALPLTLRFRPDLSLHLYISDSPCGDAHVYADEGADAPSGGPYCRRTGAKAVVGALSSDAPSGDATAAAASTDAATPCSGTTWQPRTKSGRSDLPPHKLTRSMCCSDKVARWCGVGVGGALLSHWVAAPLVLASVVVSAGEGEAVAPLAGGESGAVPPAAPAAADARRAAAQLGALRRALWDRAAPGHAAAAREFAAAQRQQEGGGVHVGDSAGALLSPAPVALHVALSRFPHGRAARGAAAAAADAEALLPTPQGPSRKRPRALTGGAGSKAAVVPCTVCLVACTPAPALATAPAPRAPPASPWGPHAPAALLVEALVGTRGTLQGSSASTPSERAASGVCKARLGAAFAAAWRASARSSEPLPSSYAAAKRAATRYRAAVAAWHAAVEGREGTPTAEAAAEAAGAGVAGVGAVAMPARWLHCDRDRVEAFALLQSAPREGGGAPTRAGQALPPQ